MAAMDAIGRLGRCFVALLLLLASGTRLAKGARISVKSQLSENDNSEARTTEEVSPVGEPWKIETLYVCMQKYQSAGAFSSQGKYVDQFCLANLETALETARNIIFVSDMTSCEAPKERHRLKLCAMKGDKPEGRISYRKRTHVPKSCFRETNSESAYAVIETSVDEETCRKMMKTPHGKQGVLGIPPTTTTTTTTTSTMTIASAEENEVADIECNCESGFIGVVEGRSCTCKKAPCEVVGSVGDGPDCSCMPGLKGEIAWHGSKADGECTAEIKHLFNDGQEHLWQYGGKSIKCCISSRAGKPAFLQDMKADLLPSEGAFGRWSKTGCGYMFGDTYHNGLKGHKGAYLTCPVPVTRIMDLLGKDFDEIKAFINVEE